ncbi:hypothetical protein KCTC32516_00287 [Polaribacter huanghezhanensis]|nr:hypothetical protein KCTC32516_00287 [Polaribacter huanghezhanensis]
MCGIVCAFDLKEKADILRPQLLEMSKKLDIVVQIGAEFTVMKKPF